MILTPLTRPDTKRSSAAWRRSTASMVGRVAAGGSRAARSLTCLPTAEHYRPCQVHLPPVSKQNAIIVLNKRSRLIVALLPHSSRDRRRRRTRGQTEKLEVDANETSVVGSLTTDVTPDSENKKTDAATNKDKETAWKKIEFSFNSSGITTSVRSWKTLKLKYEGIKKTMKKKSSLQRQKMYKTGGGPSNAPPFIDVEEK
ncbi:unnamed protein product, partial [Plutella xylostella]